MNENAFTVFPWERPFLPALLDFALEKTEGDISRALFVFPHARPARYLRDLLRSHPGVKRPCILPEMLPVSSLFNAVARAAGQPLLPEAGLLDRVALLLSCVRSLPQDDAARSTAGRGGLPLDDPKRFFPWGMRLAALMEDFFSHNVTPDNYVHVEGEVSPLAAALLGRLSQIHARYVAALTERGWSTPGLSARTAVSERQAIHRIAAGRIVFLSGFHTLNGCEEALFRHMWERGNGHAGGELHTEVCLHGDSALVTSSGVSGGMFGGVSSGGAHWSCAPLARWAARWGARLVLSPGLSGFPESTKPRLRFIAGFDLHSQLAELERDLAAAGDSAFENTAIILPEASLLLPTLHHLPDADVNISMGYPLSRSPLFRLLESIMEAQEKAVCREQGPESEQASPSRLYHWKTAVALLRHPYLKMLGDPESGQPDTIPKGGLRRLLHALEARLRDGTRYADIAGQAHAVLAQEPPEGTPPALAALFRELLRAVFFAWQDCDSAAKLAAALEGTVSLLLRYGGQLWPRFPIDAECLYRLMQSVIPQLARSVLKDEILDARVLFMILRRLLEAERAPFEADPLVGLQVMGVLESRLLTFERLFILDATEDRLPGVPGQDPLLPDSLRPLAGLPDARGRERVAAYNFFRLAAGAGELTVYWQEGVEPQGLSDGKKLRSRFVEELLWREEQAAKTLFIPGTDAVSGPLRQIRCVLPPLPLSRRVIPATPASRGAMGDLLAAGISPSLLDAYLRCPARFFYERIVRLRGVAAVNEGDDPRELGTLLHSVLQDFFSTRLGRPVRAGAEEKKALARHFHTALARSPLRAALPPDSLLMLEESGPERLIRLLAVQEGSVPVRLEEELQAEFSIPGHSRRSYLVRGILDRVDEREGRTVILDYKTGGLRCPDPALWTDDAFWDALHASLTRGMAWDADRDAEFFESLAERVKSVQLPAYLFLHMQGSGFPAHDAAYVKLGDGAEEVALFGEKMPDTLREAACGRIPALLAAIVRHMEDAPAFIPRHGTHCDWCSYKYSCIVLSDG